jgi:hypothetical protein
MKRIIMYRLYDPHYGTRGNTMTLSVSLRDDDTLTYSYYSGWQESGMGHSICNMQLRESLPIGIGNFENANELHDKISRVLSTGVGSKAINTYEILNDLK